MLLIKENNKKKNKENQVLGHDPESCLSICNPHNLTSLKYSTVIIPFPHLLLSDGFNITLPEKIFVCLLYFLPQYIAV